MYRVIASTALFLPCPCVRPHSTCRTHGPPYGSAPAGASASVPTAVPNRPGARPRSIQVATCALVRTPSLPRMFSAWRSTVRSEYETPGDVLVAQASRDQLGHLQLAGAQRPGRSGGLCRGRFPLLAAPQGDLAGDAQRLAAGREH